MSLQNIQEPIQDEISDGLFPGIGAKKIQSVNNLDDLKSPNLDQTLATASSMNFDTQGSPLSEKRRKMMSITLSQLKASRALQASATDMQRSPLLTSANTNAVKIDISQEASHSPILQEESNDQKLNIGKPSTLTFTLNSPALSSASPHELSNMSSQESSPVHDSPQSESPKKSPKRLTQSLEIFRKMNRITRVFSPDRVAIPEDSTVEPSPVSSVQDRKTKRMTSTLSLADNTWMDESHQRQESNTSQILPSQISLFKGHRDWYPAFLQSCKSSYKEASKKSQDFSNVISLTFIFGEPASDATQHMMAAARAYERVYNELSWNRQVLAPKFVKKERDLVPVVDADDSSDDGEDEADFKYRILDIFKDSPLGHIKYSEGAIVSAAQVKDIVDALIFPLNQDMKNTMAFICCYKTIIQPLGLLESLTEWYHVENSSDCTLEQEQFLKKNRRGIQTRVIRILSSWISTHWMDFVDESMFQELMSFVTEISEISFGDSQKLTQAIREQRLAWYTTIYIPPFQLRKTPMSSEMLKPIGLMWDPEEFAIQLTHIDHFYFVQLTTDALTQLMIGVDCNAGASNVALKLTLEYVAWFRLISSYVASLIVKEDTTKKKLIALKRWIKIAKECRKLNNFNTMFAIIHGLKRPFIVKLSALWEQLTSKYVDTLLELDKYTTDYAQGYTKFWETWNTVTPPAVPFIGAYIHDILDIQQNTPSKLAQNHINVSKLYDFHFTFSELEAFKSQYPDKLLKLDSAIQWGFPQPGTGTANPVLDYPSYIITHIREWASLFAIDDGILDSI